MNKKPNILILTSDSVENPLGGLGVFHQETLKRLPDYNFTVIGQDFYYDSQKRAHRAYAPGDNYRYFRKLHDLEFVKFAAEQCDIIHAFDRQAFKVANIVKKSTSKPYIAHIQLFQNYLYEDIGFTTDTNYRSVENNALKLANHVVFCSEGYKERFPRDYDHKSHVIPNGVSVSDIDKGEQVELPGDQPLKIVYIGRYQPQKNIESVIKCSVPENCDLIFAGKLSGSMEFQHRFKTFIRKNENAHHIGPQWGEDKINLLCSADAVLFPSVHEPFGIVGVEAMASRSLLIASGVDGMQDYCYPENHLPCGIAPKSIQTALNVFSRMAKKEREHITEKAYAQASAFDWERTATELNDLYEMAMEESNA